jgi:RES domain-containing protein
VKRKHITRNGTYYRVFEAGWEDCADTSFSKLHGGRWNPPGEFGALYLNHTLGVARANARTLYAGTFYRPEDLTDEAELQLQEFLVPKETVLDCISENGVTACGFAPTYPFGYDDHAPCQGIARDEYAHKSNGVATRCASECTETSFVGEELALFDRVAGNATKGQLFRFVEWYPLNRAHRANEWNP